MLRDSDAIATLAVRDLPTAARFYEERLGFQPAPGEQDMGVRMYRSGKSLVMVYESQFAGTNQATAVNWFVPDLQRLVGELRSKGITFEHYDFPGMTLEGDVHVMGDIRAAWFKDPDGNILALMEPPT